MGSKSRSSSPSFVSKFIRKKSDPKSKCKSKSKSKSSVVGVLNAYLSWKKKIVVMGSQEQESPRIAAKDDRGNEEISRWTNGVYFNGQFFLVSMGTMLSSGCYVPIIDKNGSLLGEFRKLDDDLCLRDWEV